MSRRAPFAVAAIVIAGVLVWGLLAAPLSPAVGSADGAADAGDDLGEQLIEGSQRQGAPNAVAGVLFDLRATGTLGEALALFAASAGLQLVLRLLPSEGTRSRPRRGRPDRPEPPPTSDAVRAAAIGLVVPTAAFAVFTTLRGHLGTGGGLQGGVLAVSALALVLLAGRYRAHQALSPERHLDLLEAISLGGYVTVGLAGLLVGGAFLENVLPSGPSGGLVSSGTIVALSVLVAIEAGAALLLIVGETAEEPAEREGAA